MRALVLFSGAVLGLLACASEEPATGPSTGTRPEFATVKSYTAVDLGTPLASGEATAINPAGAVVGQVGDAFLWEKGVVVTDEFATVGFFRAFDINAAGQVVGSGSPPGAGGWHALLWEKGVMTDLGTLGGAQSQSMGINPKGQVVGNSTTATGAWRAFLWEGGVMTDLGTLGGAFSFAADINPSGQVVGESYTAGNVTTRAFLWEKGVMTDLGTLGGEFISSRAEAINATGQVVGDVSSLGYGVIRPVIWEKGVITELATLGGGGFGRALDINPAGQVVGWSTDRFSGFRPTLWTRN